MIGKFKGHHFVEDTKRGEPPSRHHCERCRMKAVLKPDGSTEFEVGGGAPIRIGAYVALNASVVPGCREPNP